MVDCEKTHSMSTGMDDSSESSADIFAFCTRRSLVEKPFDESFYVRQLGQSFAAVDILMIIVNRKSC